jgi:deazaflavin-dependent oxidoreductase (nitroreductase family)
MWFMNNIFNPLVRLILHSPLHGMVSDSILLITYKGRKSGKEYSLPVQYVQDNRTIYVIVGMPEKKIWWCNLRRGAKVHLWLAGKGMIGEAALLEGNADSEAIFHALNLYLRRYPAAAKKRGIRVDENGSFNQEDVRQAASTTIIVQVEFDQ